MQPLTKLLVIEDDPDFLQLLEVMFAELASFYEVEYVSTYAEGLEGLTAGNHDVYLVDYLLDLGNTGDSLVDEAARRSYRVVMLTGVQDYKLRVRMIRAGAKDYISKDELDSTRLHQVISNALRF